MSTKTDHYKLKVRVFFLEKIMILEQKYKNKLENQISI